MQAYRIGDRKGAYAVYSGEGSRENEGRWHSRGQNVIYASKYYSTAVLEKLVRTGEMPPNQYFVEIIILPGVSYEVVTKDSVPDWCNKDQVAARKFGSTWFRECRSAILIVPSVVARVDQNVLINPHHDDYSQIKAGLETPVWWDSRLFPRGLFPRRRKATTS